MHRTTETRPVRDQGRTKNKRAWCLPFLGLDGNTRVGDGEGPATGDGTDQVRPWGIVRRDHSQGGRDGSRSGDPSFPATVPRVTVREDEGGTERERDRGSERGTGEGERTRQV